MHRIVYKSGAVEERGTQKPTMSRYIVLLGLLAVMGAVYGGDEEVHCGENEKWNICGRLCEPSCADQKPNPQLCPGIECTKMTAACRCDSGCFRDTNGSCVLRENCQKKQDQQ